MSQYDSLAAYHARKHAEAQLELERLRRSALVAREEPCPGPHVGPVVGTLAVVGGIVIGAVLLSALFSRD